MAGGDADRADRTGDDASFPAVIRRAGAIGWSLLGIIVLAAVVAVALGALSGIVVPLVVAVLLSIVLEPVSRALKRLGLRPAAATTITLLAAVTVAAGTVAIVVWGFVQQWPQIYRQLLQGWSRLVEAAADLDIDPHVLARARAMWEHHGPELGQGVFGAVTSTVYGTASLLVGMFLAAFFLFFALRDAGRFPSWLARTTSLDAEEVDTVIALTRTSVRGYFRGTAVTALITAPVFMVPLLLLRVPLALPIFILYFTLSFLPYVGAWITGVFAVLIAFGSVGPTAALILGVTFLMSNGTVQSVVSSWALGSSLRLHPVAVLLATMVGGTVAGLLGMVIGAPLLAAAATSVVAVRRLRRPAPGSGESASP